MKLIAATVLSLCLVLSLGLGSINTVNAAPGAWGTFHFKAYIDGDDYVYIQNAGGIVWYEHMSWERPGEQSPYSPSSPAPTTIDGVDWYPVWPHVTEHEFSSTYTSEHPENYPSGVWTADMGVPIPIHGRALVTLVQSPNAGNGYTAKIYINEDPYGGADWYEFELTWLAPSFFVIPELPLGTVMGVVLCFAAFGAIGIKRRTRLLT